MKRSRRWTCQLRFKRPEVDSPTTSSERLWVKAISARLNMPEMSSQAAPLQLRYWRRTGSLISRSPIRSLSLSLSYISTNQFHPYLVINLYLICLFSLKSMLSFLLQTDYILHRIIDEEHELLLPYLITFLPKPPTAIIILFL